ncbi:MAG: transposase [Planctomycetaceae bacterium]|nr:transposase [Planctomycetaceae bacterium]
MSARPAVWLSLPVGFCEDVWGLEATKRPKDSQGFVPVAKRWVVKRTFAWMGRKRSLSKDYERTITSSEATIKLANITLLLRRLAPNKNTKKIIIATNYKKTLFD